MEKTPNYTPAQEQRIREAAAEGPDGRLNLAIATALAAEFGGNKTYRSVIAKASRMDPKVPYARKEPTTKTGEPVQKKDSLASEISGLLDIEVSTLDGLEKAPKGALQAIRNALRSRQAA